MRIKFAIVACLMIFSLIACQSEEHQRGEIDDGTDIKALVEAYNNGDIRSKSASVTARELIITKEDGSEMSYDLPDDEFFVSIAPYRDETHACTYHSLTGCQGEMAHTDFQVLIKDKDGNVFINKMMNSGANGFLDVWLPRHDSFDVQITYDDETVESELSTFDDDKTCITTMQLTPHGSA